MWSTQWPSPPQDYDDLQDWRIYVLIAENCNLTPWEEWVYKWMKQYDYAELPEVAREWLHNAYANHPVNQRRR